MTNLPLLDIAKTYLDHIGVQVEVGPEVLVEVLEVVAAEDLGDGDDALEGDAVLLDGLHHVVQLSADAVLDLRRPSS